MGDGLPLWHMRPPCVGPDTGLSPFNDDRPGEKLGCLGVVLPQPDGAVPSVSG